MITSLLLFFSLGSFSSRTIQRAPSAISKPWPTSPNITANRKGKVMMVYNAAKGTTGMKRRVNLERSPCREMRSLAWCRGETSSGGRRSYLGSPHGSWPLRTRPQCSGTRLWRSWGGRGWVAAWWRAGGCRKSRPRCRFSSDEAEAGHKMENVRQL